MTDQNEAARRAMDEDSVALRLLAKDAEIERLRGLLRGVLLTPIPELERHTIDTQDEIINELRDDIKRLRELVEASKEDRKAIDELVDENLRLRELLKDVVGDVVQAADWERLMEEIEKEVGDG